MKKTLIIKIPQDVTLASDSQIEAIKGFWRASFDWLSTELDFELRAEGTEDALARWLQLIRGEFKEHDDAPQIEEGEEDGVETVIRIESGGKILEFPTGNAVNEDSKATDE